MTTAMNACKVLPCGGAVSGAGATERAPGKPQGRFADTPALVKLREEVGSDKIKPAATPDDGRSTDKQTVMHTAGQPNAPAKEKKKAAIAEEQGVAIGQPQGAVEMLAQTQVAGEESKADPSAVALPKAVLGEPATDKVIAGKSSVSHVQSLHRPVHEVLEHPPRPAEPQTLAKQEPKDRAVDGTTVVADFAPRGKAEARVPEPVPTDIDGKAPSKPSKQTSDGPAPTGQAAPRGPERTSQGGTIIKGADSLRHPQAGRVGLPPDNIGPPVAIKAAPIEQSPGTEPKPGIEPKLDQAVPEAPSQRQSPTVTAAQVPERKPGALLPEKHPVAAPASGGNPSIRTLRAEAVPAAGKEIRSIEPNPGLQMRAEFSVSSHGESMPVSQRISTPTHTPIPDNPASRTPVQHIGGQILDSVHASLSRGDRQVLVRLHPPELGTVLVRFQEQGRQVTGILEVGRSDTRHEIEQALPQVLRGLQDAGVQVRRFEVVMSDQSERDFSKGQWQQDAGFQQHGSGQQRAHSPVSPRASWSQDDVSHSSESEEVSSIDPPAGVTQGRLDMLL